MEIKQEYIVSIILIIIILGGLAIHHEYTKPKPSVKPSGSSVPSAPRTYTPPAPQPVITASPEDYERFEQIMPQTDLVNALPEGVEIQMSFFNFNSGSREWERDYILSKGNVREGISSNPDMKLILHSRNLPKLQANNVCQIFQQAKAQGDFGSELLISKAKFTWRYKSMMSYKSCLGF
jgi:hypothetical protein